MASFSPTLLRDPDQGGVRAVARELLHDAVAAREKMLAGEDPEALHDFRVAVRRLRSWLRSFSALLDERPIRRGMRGLRRVARATSPARDAEVLISWLESLRKGRTARQRRGITWLLDEARGSGAVAFDDRIARDFDEATERLGEALPVYRLAHHLDGEPLSLAFSVSLAEALRHALVTLRRRLTMVRDDADDQAIHRARIAGKRLRYLLEPMVAHVVGADVAIDTLKRLQDTLGDLHDSHVWNAFLRERATRYGASEARALLEEPTEAEKPRRRGGTTDIRPGLLIVSQELRDRVARDFAAFQDCWVGDAPAAFFASIEAIADSLEHWSAGDTEIERKYLLRGLPTDMPDASVGVIEQGYLPGTRLVERVRRTQWPDGEVFHRTVKSGAGLVRVELEDETSRGVFYTMWPLTEGRRVTKRRHVVNAGDLRWEIDEFTDRDLVLAEVELPTADHPVEIPAWLDAFVERDVTGDATYANSNLAR